MSESKPKYPHSDLVKILIPKEISWVIGVDREDVNHLLDGNIFTRYQIASGKDLADAMSYLKPEKFRHDKDCKVLFIIRLKESYNLQLHELDEIKTFLDEHIQSENIRWGLGIDNSMTENIAVTIAASYKYVLKN